LDHVSDVPPTPAGVSTPGGDPGDLSELTWLNRRLRDLLMHAPSAIGITVGPEHRWVYVNLARIAMAGRKTAQDFVGKTVRESYPELVDAPFFSALDRVYRTGVPFVGKELLAPFHRGPDSAPEEAYVDCVYQPIVKPDGQIEGVLIHTVEVSEKVFARRAIEEARQREEQQRALAEFERNQFRELFQQAPAGIAILNGPEHRWSFANPAYCAIVGRSCDELLGRTMRAMRPELTGQGFFELLDEVYRSGAPYIGKNMKVLLRRGGSDQLSEAYFDFVYQPVRNISGQVEGVMILAVETTEQVKARTQLESRVEERTLELQRAHESLQLLSGRLMQAQDEERRRVARELHDSVGQYLAALQMNLEALPQDLEGVTERFRQRLKDSVDLVGRCTTEIRTLSYLLHPPLLDEMGLASAIAWYTHGFSERSGIAVELEMPEDLPRFSSELETALFRIVQQSLANIHKHSESKLARVRMAMAGQNLTLEISDAGRGISPDILSKFREGRSPGVGIAGMRERVIGLRGTFDLNSDPNGTKIAVRVPVSEQLPVLPRAM
jgi:PAS domain S-box-containing protein